MTSEKTRQDFLCKRLERLGFAPGHRVKLYGDEVDLVSGPSHDGSGYAVVGVSRRSGELRRVRLPLTVVQSIEREFYVIEQSALAA